MAACKAPYITTGPNNSVEVVPGKLCSKPIHPNDLKTASRCPQCLTNGKTTYACPRSVDLIRDALKKKYHRALVVEWFAPICYECLPKLRAAPSSKPLTIRQTITEDGSHTSNGYEPCDCVTSGINEILHSGKCYSCTEEPLLARQLLVHECFEDHPVWTKEGLDGQSTTKPGTWMCLCAKVRKEGEGAAARICLGCANWQDYDGQGNLKVAFPW